ncbi:mitochondrial amidoxime reducing component 2-like [Phymastichus coffea]|uniref:mitochondrial amidoxime reducing component 2-like n=1 Tax=Phymastichus coffea TaxID=108790 RepID=UPI00273BCDF4|nr:mitochondrial amidoxime reducing component 2-like [Phymastichus coffea]
MPLSILFGGRMHGLTAFLMSASALTAMSLGIAWYDNYRKIIDERKLAKKILSSPDASWRRVARVKKLLGCPLKSGGVISVEERRLSERGVTTHREVCPAEYRMFIAIDENTSKLVTARSHPKLMLAKLTFLAKNRAKLETSSMPPLEFSLPDVRQVKSVMLITWCGGCVTGIDCGPEPSKWLSQYLNGSDYGIRLAMRAPNQRRDIVRAWKSHAELYPNVRDDESGLFSDLASYVIMPRDDSNNSIERPIQSLPMRPNIVVEGCQPRDENDWEWIKIGKQAIIRRLKWRKRGVMSRFDPDTGIPDLKYEPLKTSRTLKDPALNKLKSYASTIGVYCGLYRAGTVCLNDDVYVYHGD